jgi:hypothetical protein
MALRRWNFSGVVEQSLRLLENLLGRTPVFGAYRVVTTDATFLDSDDVIGADTTTGSFSVNLPVASHNLGRRFTLKKISSDGNTVTLDGAGGETIDGSLTKAWTAQYTGFTVQSTGVSWMIVAKAIG